MKVAVTIFCLIGAVFANPISFSVLESSDHDANTTESLSISQSSETDTSELHSSDENTSNESSESVSVESEDTTSEESNSQSDEDDQLNSMTETSDNSMGSEENVRKRLVQVFASVAKVLSAEDNSSAEVKGQPKHLSSDEQLTEKQLASTSSTVKQKTKTVQSLAENPMGSSETTSTDTSDVTAAAAAAGDSSESNSSESNSSESNSSESSDESRSTEDSNASDSTELAHVKSQSCVNGTQSCESEEQFFQNMGDDAHFSVDNLLMPDEDERELSLRR